MKNNRKFGVFVSICLVLILGLLAVMGACAEPATPQFEPVTLRFNVCDMEQNVAVQVMKDWSDELYERTEGAVTVTPYYNSTLTSQDKIYDSLKEGIADMAFALTAFTPGVFPLNDCIGLPFYDRPASTRPSRIRWELHQKFPELQAEFADVKVITQFSLTSSQLITNRGPILTLEDAKGLKMSCAGKTIMDTFTALGMMPATGPMQALYMDLQTGVVDGCFTTIDNMDTRKFYEVCKYVTNHYWRYNSWFVVMSWEAWNSLPPDIQEIIDDMSGGELADRLDKAIWDNDVKVRAKLAEENGVTFSELSPEEAARWAELTRPVIDSWVAEMEAKGLPAEEIVAEMYSLFEKYP